MARSRFLLSLTAAAALMFTASGSAFAGGPRWVTGSSYFNRPGVPIAWAGGQVRYYTDQGALSATVDNATANALVAAAAAPWNGVIDATVRISQGGTLAEDVSGANTYAGASGVVFPADVQRSSVAVPLAVIYDADGAVTDAMLGNGASDPASCWLNGVTENVDNMSQDGVIVHALLVLNGRCAGSAQAQSQMQYQLERMFGRVLGLDWSQTNDNVFTGVPTPIPADYMAWPLMHPIDVRCGPYTYQCMANPFSLRLDDRAALARLYPVTAQNIAQYPGKQDIVKSSIDVTGQMLFADGQPMQGVNVLVTYVSPNYSKVWPGAMMSMVTGSDYRGNAGNPVTGYATGQGIARFDQFGSASATDIGSFSTLGLEQTLEPGRTFEGLLITAEPINPLYTGDFSVGPYALNQVAPSGSLLQFALGAVDGSNPVFNKTMDGSATDKHIALDGSESAPAQVPSSGFWTEQLASYGHTGWYALKVRANRSFAVETVALDELAYASTAKAMPVIGVWNGSDAIGSAPDANSPAAFNGAVAGGTTVAASTSAAETVRIAIADQRGDGRPDYNYRARVLYADSVAPATLGMGGGTLTIAGMGFRAGNVATVNGVPATVTSATATAMVVAAPPLAVAGGSVGTPVDVTVSDPATGGSTTMTAAVTYGAGPSVTDQLIVISGGGQVIDAASTLAPVTMEVTDGAGNAVPNALVQVYQTVTSYQQCPARGRCSAPALLGTANTAERSDAKGMVMVDPLQISNRPQMVNIVATAESQGVLRLQLDKHP